MVGAQLQGLITVLQCLLHKPQRGAGPAAIIKSRCVARVQVDDLAVVLNGTPVIALHKKCGSAMGEGFGEALRVLAARLDHDRAAANLAIGGYAVATRAPDPCGYRLCQRRAGNDRQRDERQAEHAQPPRWRHRPCAERAQSRDAKCPRAPCAAPRGAPSEGTGPVAGDPTAATLAHPS